MRFRRQILDPLHSPQLAKNSAALVVNTLLAALLGFLFWVVAARLHTPAAVGSVAAIVTLVPLLGTLAGFGLPETTIRYLSSSDHPRSFLKKALAASSLAGLLTGLCWWTLSALSGQLLASAPAPYLLPVLVSSVAAAAASSVSTATLIALRRPRLVLVETTVGGLSRLALVAILAPMESFGLLLSSCVGALLLLLASLTIVYRILPVTQGKHQISREERSFAAVNWLSTMVSLAPRSLVISIVSWRSGPELAAWVAIPLMVYPLLVLVPSASARALYAEAASNPHEYPRLARQTLQTSLLYTSLFAATATIATPLVLAVFGSDYARESTSLLRLLTVASVAAVPNYLIDTTLNIRKDHKGFLAANILGVVSSLVVVTALSPYGAVGIGLAWISSQALYTLAGLAILFRRPGSFLRPDLKSLATALSYLRKRGTASVEPTRGLDSLPTLVFIITYGRTGSTVLQSLLNEHVGVSIRGENHNATVELYRAYRALKKTTSHAPPTSLPPSDPWFGANLVSPESALESFRKVVLDDLLDASPGLRMTGFKEVRHTPEHFRDFDELLGYVGFLQELFPSARFVINVRSPELCSASGWWRTDPDAYATLTTSKQWMLDLHDRLTPSKSSILMDHDQWSNDPAELLRLQEFLGLPADPAVTSKVLGKKLIHMQPAP